MKIASRWPRGAWRWLLVFLLIIYLYLPLLSMHGHSRMDMRLTRVLSIPPKLIEGGPATAAAAAARADLAHACGSIDACISIHVFLYRRLNATISLIEALGSADYSSSEGVPLPLVLHVDVPKPDDEHDEKAEAHLVQQYVSTLIWPHGPLVLDIKESHTGLKSSWLNAWIDPRPNDVMIAFEDDMMPSPLYFKWLMKVLHDYNLLQPGRDKNLLGLSLSPIRLDEISYPFKRWEASKVVGSKFPLYLHAVPSSWGAVYFGGPWSEFVSFVQLRGLPSFYPGEYEEKNQSQLGPGTRLGDPNLWLPNSRADCWVGSWKRFMIDFAFGRGAYMLYPNLPGEAGLATSTFLIGEHSYGAKSYKKNARMAVLAKDGDINFAATFPDYKSLPLVDLHGLRINRWELTRRGDDFLRDLASLGPKYGALTTAWKRFCLLDDVQGRVPSPIFLGRRYLVFAPQMGLNNQFKSIVHGALWADVLGRTLVLPRLFWPRVREARHSVAYRDVFIPADVKSLLPRFDFIYEDQLVVSAWDAVRVTMIEPPPVFDKLNITYLERYGWGSLPTVDLKTHHSYLCTKDGVYTSLGSCSDEVMILDGLYNQPIVPFDKYPDLWNELLHPTPMLQGIIEGVKAKIISPNRRSYDCLHMRFGDFDALCQGDSSISPWLGVFRSRGWKCSITPEEVTFRANRTTADAILIISDEPERALSYLSKGITKHIITSSHIKNFIDRRLAHASLELKAIVAAVVDQRICAEAERVVLNGYSTFSGGVRLYRKQGMPTEYW